MRALSSRTAHSALLLFWCLAAAACVTPVGVAPVETQVANRLLSESALSVGRPSEPSRWVLRRLDLLDRFAEEPAAVLAALHRGLAAYPDEDLLFALAELSFLHAERSGEQSHYLASAVYAYALLFPGDGRAVRLHRSDPRLRLAHDFYNQGLAEGLAVRREDGEEVEIRVASHVYPLPFGTLRVEARRADRWWAGYRLERFVATSHLQVRGLRNRYRRPGLGMSLAASLAPSQAVALVPGAGRIYPRTRVPITGVLRIDDPRGCLRTGEVAGALELHAADHADAVVIDGQAQPLEVDFTAALALLLEGHPMYDVEVRGFLRGGLLPRLRPRDRQEDGLVFLQPYRAGKIPVVLVHGTASSPARWAELINELDGDPRLRERYQIWTFIYDSGNPIVYSAGRLRDALSATVREIDPHGADPALRRMVVIGHSQGGLLTKLTAVESGPRFWHNVTPRPFESVKMTEELRDLLSRSLFFTPLPFVERVVFVATPHRGARLAGGRLGALAAWLVTLPVDYLARTVQFVRRIEDGEVAAVLRRPPTAVDNMNPRHPFIRAISSMAVDARIPAHSIIAVTGNGPPEDGDDGVVTYRSARLPEAVSEVVVRSGHSVQGHPQAIEEIRRILLEHAARH